MVYSFYSQVFLSLPKAQCVECVDGEPSLTFQSIFVYAECTMIRVIHPPDQSEVRMSCAGQSDVTKIRVIHPPVSRDADASPV